MNGEEVGWAGQSVEELRPDEGARYWRASKHEVQRDEKGRLWVGAARHAKWRRFSPLTLYKPSAIPREFRKGPHTEFLRLKESIIEMMGLDTELNEAKSVASFADSYGLLGLVYGWYSAPILPDGKLYVLPDAAITKTGEWRPLDNGAKDIRETDGFRLLQRAFQEKLDLADLSLGPRAVARPSELKFAYKRNQWGEKPDAAGFEPDPELVDWKTVREQFGVVMLLDTTSSSGARLQTTRERAEAWHFVLPAYSKPLAELSDSEKRNLALDLRTQLSGVSPYPSLNEEGEWERGWRCPSLLQAICLMLYYDLTGHVDIRKCALPTCGDYFRATKGSSIMYCPPAEPSKQSKCASAASSRSYRKRKTRRADESW